MLAIARYLIWIGLFLIVIGGVLYFVSRTGFTFDRIPGDFKIERNNFSCVVALGTSLILSVLLTVILNLLVRILNK